MIQKTVGGIGDILVPFLIKADELLFLGGILIWQKTEKHHANTIFVLANARREEKRIILDIAKSVINIILVRE